MSQSITISDLGVRYPTPEGSVIALEAVTIDVRSGEKLGIIGESGSGKSTLVNALSGSLNATRAEISGTALLGSQPILALEGQALLSYRRDSLAYIGQDPHGALDPTARIATQLRQVLELPRRADLRSELTFHLGRVGFPDPESVARRYPHQLSGGMAQRAAIALALAREPELVIADEPTAALDSTLRTRILDLISRLVEASSATLIMVSHDLRAIERYCGTTAVMYGGRIVEMGPTPTLFERPRHPYTAGLLGSALGLEAAGVELEGIPGTQHARHNSIGCVFAERCTYRVTECSTSIPAARWISQTQVACHLADLLDLKGR